MRFSQHSNITAYNSSSLCLYEPLVRSLYRLQRQRCLPCKLTIGRRRRRRLESSSGETGSLKLTTASMDAILSAALVGALVAVAVAAAATAAEAEERSHRAADGARCRTR